MSQQTFSAIVPTVTSGNQLASILFDFKEAVMSGFSGITRPSELLPGGYWVDITNDDIGTWDFKLWTGTQDILVFTINKSASAVSVPAAEITFQVDEIADDALGPVIKLYKKRLTFGGQVLTGDTLGEIQFYGTRDTGVNVLQARIQSKSLDNMNASFRGAYMSFDMTSDSTNTVAEILRLMDGKVGVGGVIPDDTFHVDGTGFKTETASDDAIGNKLKFKKSRNGGQVLSGDVIGQEEFVGTSDISADVGGVMIETSARENHTSTAQGSRVSIKNKKTTESAYTEQIILAEDATVTKLNSTSMTVTTLNVTGVLNATTTESGTITEATDPSIKVNKGGNGATATANTAGVEVVMTDAPTFKMGYDGTKASKFVVGEVGTLKEVVTADAPQTLTSKSIFSCSLQTPNRLDFRKDTYANLSSLSSIFYGELQYATDTKEFFCAKAGVMTKISTGELPSFFDALVVNGRMVETYDWTAPSKLTNPVTLPAAGGSRNEMAFSPDGRYMAMAESVSPFLGIYENLDGFMVRMANVATPPTGVASGLSFSPDGRFLAVAHTTTPFVSVYERFGSTFTKIANPATLPVGNCQKVVWSPENRYLFAALSTPSGTTVGYIWERTGTTLTFLNTVDISPAVTGVSGIGIHPDGFLFILTNVSPFCFNINLVTGANPASPSLTLPFQANGVSFSPDGTRATFTYLNPVAAGKAFQTYSITGGGNGTYTAVANADVMPTVAAGNVCSSPRWSLDSKFLTIVMGQSPFIAVYKRNATGGPTKLADPGSLPLTGPTCVAWAPDNKFLAVGGGNTSPYFEVYQTSNTVNLYGKVPNVLYNIGDSRDYL